MRASREHGATTGHGQAKYPGSTLRLGASRKVAHLEKISKVEPTRSGKGHSQRAVVIRVTLIAPFCAALAHAVVESIAPFCVCTEDEVLARATAGSVGGRVVWRPESDVVQLILRVCSMMPVLTWAPGHLHCVFCNA